MKKFLALLSVLVLSMSMLVGCGSKSSANKELVVYFVPSRDPAEILEATKPLSEMLKAELSKLGYDFEKVKIDGKYVRRKLDQGNVKRYGVSTTGAVRNTELIYNEEAEE